MQHVSMMCQGSRLLQLGPRAQRSSWQAAMLGSIERSGCAARRPAGGATASACRHAVQPLGNLRLTCEPAGRQACRDTGGQDKVQRASTKPLMHTPRAHQPRRPSHHWRPAGQSPNQCPALPCPRPPSCSPEESVPGGGVLEALLPLQHPRQQQHAEPQHGGDHSWDAQAVAQHLQETGEEEKKLGAPCRQAFNAWPERKSPNCCPAPTH